MTEKKEKPVVKTHTRRVMKKADHKPEPEMVVADRLTAELQRVHRRQLGN